MDLKDVLRELADIHGVSGFEYAVAQNVMEIFNRYCDNVRIDKFGNVIGFRHGYKEGNKTVLLDAHIDQIGFIVSDVIEGGFVKFRPVGGVDPRMLLGKEVSICGHFGVVCCMPPHIINDTDKAISIDDMHIDIGFDAGSDIIGKPIVFNDASFFLGEKCISGKAMDDRAGIACIINVLDNLKDIDLGFNLVISASTQEERGCMGVQTLMYGMNPDIAIMVDVSHGKTPDADDDRTYEFGGGAMIGYGPSLDRNISDRLVSAAIADDVKYQLEVMEGNNGTNAWPVQTIKGGIKTALISIPLRYMHTPIETVHIDDLYSVSRLIQSFLTDDINIKGF